MTPADIGADALPDLCLDFAIKAKDALRLRTEALALYERLTAVMPATDPRRDAVGDLRAMLTDAASDALRERVKEAYERGKSDLAREQAEALSAVGPIAPHPDLVAEILAPILRLRVKLTDEAAAAEVTPEQANAYLAARGWILVPVEPRLWHVWNNDGSQALVPVHGQWSDYGQRMADLLNLLAAVEQRSPLALWLDLTSAGPATPQAPTLSTRAVIDHEPPYQAHDARHSIALSGEDAIVSESWHTLTGEPIQRYEVRLPFAKLVHVALNTTAQERDEIDQRADWRGVD